MADLGEESCRIIDPADVNGTSNLLGVVCEYKKQILTFPNTHKKNMKYTPTNSESLPLVGSLISSEALRTGSFDSSSVYNRCLKDGETVACPPNTTSFLIVSEDRPDNEENANSMNNGILAAGVFLPRLDVAGEITCEILDLTKRGGVVGIVCEYTQDVLMPSGGSYSTQTGTVNDHDHNAEGELKIEEILDSTIELKRRAVGSHTVNVCFFLILSNSSL